MADWRTTASKILHETAWIKLREDKVLNQNGTPLTYTYMELQNPSVFIVAVNERREVAMQQVYRHTIKQTIWETPAGFIESGESPLATAQRELLEESGLASDEWAQLGSIFQSVGTANAPAYVFLAKNVRPVGASTDLDEDIKSFAFFSFEAIEAMLKNGELSDSPVIAALYMARVSGT